MAMTHQAFETKVPPPEAIRAALLLGIVVGELDSSVPTCESCRLQLEQLRGMMKQQLPAPAPREPRPAQQNHTTPHATPQAEGK